MFRKDDNMKTENMEGNVITNNDIFNLLKESTTTMNKNMEELRNELKNNDTKIDDLKEEVKKSERKKRRDSRKDGKTTQ